MSIYQFEWEGEPHKSESVKYVDGQETARNLYLDPRFTKSPYSGLNANVEPGSWNNDYGVTLTAQSDSENGPSRAGLQQSLGSYFTRKYAAVAVDAQAAHEDQKLRALFYNAELKSSLSVTQDISTDRERYVFSREVDHEGGWNRIYLDFLNNPPVEEGDLLGRLDRVHIAIADTEEEALRQVETYFDGDTPDYGIGKTKVFYNGKWVEFNPKYMLGDG